MQKSGFTREDAEAFIEYIKTASRDEVATKKDIDRLEKRMDKLESKFETLEIKFENLEIKIEASADRVTAKLIQWMATFMIGQIVTIFALLKMFDKI